MDCTHQRKSPPLTPMEPNPTTADLLKSFLSYAPLWTDFDKRLAVRIAALEKLEAEWDELAARAAADLPPDFEQDELRRHVLADPRAREVAVTYPDDPR
jgi:hypothetical protein